MIDTRCTRGEMLGLLFHAFDLRQGRAVCLGLPAVGRQRTQLYLRSDCRVLRLALVGTQAHARQLLYDIAANFHFWLCKASSAKVQDKALRAASTISVSSKS